MSILANFPLVAAIVSILSAQAVKVPIQFVGRRSWQTGMAFSTGGMPSSHSAAMAGLSAAIGIDEGLDSPLFAVAVVVGMIIMFDAAGVRRHAGLQASVLNRFLRKMPDLHGEHHPVKELKELLGHRPIEVFAGAIWGIGIAVAVYFCFTHEAVITNEKEAGTRSDVSLASLPLLANERGDQSSSRSPGFSTVPLMPF